LEKVVVETRIISFVIRNVPLLPGLRLSRSAMRDRFDQAQKIPKGLYVYSYVVAVVFYPILKGLYVFYSVFTYNPFRIGAFSRFGL